MDGVTIKFFGQFCLFYEILLYQNCLDAPVAHSSGRFFCCIVVLRPR